MLPGLDKTALGGNTELALPFDFFSSATFLFTFPSFTVISSSDSTYTESNTGTRTYGAV